MGSNIEVLKKGQWVAGQPAAGDTCRETLACGAMIEFLFDGSHLSIERVRSDKTSDIKRQAEEQISALDWRLERARERAELGVSDVETVEEVMTLREQIRAASNQAEMTVNTLKTIEEVESFEW